MSKYSYMQEAWGIDGNPFPSDAISKGNEPYNAGVFPDEQELFYSQLVHGAAMDRRGFGFLWSKGRGGDDTGFGKTSLLRYSAKAINKDLGKTVLKANGLKPDRIEQHRSIAAYASLTTTDRTGVYPILFAAVEYLADPNSNDGSAVIDVLREQILENNKLSKSDSNGLRKAVLDARRKLGMTLPPLRPDALDAFCDSTAGSFATYLGEVSPTSRIRNGLAYFDFMFTVASAAGVKHLFVFVDQLEDLANNQTVTRAKRSREIGRLRDIISEMQPFVERVHFVFTFHIRAAHVLLDSWVQNRLPSFDAEDPANQGSVVVLRGLRDTSQASTLLKTYLDARREYGPTDTIAPFTEDAVRMLLERTEGRPGLLLSFANKVFDRAADQERPEIDGAFVAGLLGGTAVEFSDVKRLALSDDIRDARTLDELLR